MDEYFIAMNEKVRRKYYPQGFFAAGQKHFKNSAKFVYVVFGIIAAICGAFSGLFLYWMVKAAQEGDNVLSGVPVVVVGLGLMIFSIGMIVFFARRYNMNTLQWMEQFAENNGLTLADMRTFDQQSNASDALLVRLAGKKKIVVDDIGTGLLTRDYIAFQNTVMKRNEVSAVCFYDHLLVYPTEHGQKIVHVLCLGIVSKGGLNLHSEVKRQAGEKLMELLLQSNPRIKTWDGEVLKEEEFQALCTQKA